jgi:hypothetical protein
LVVWLFHRTALQERPRTSASRATGPKCDAAAHGLILPWTQLALRIRPLGSTAHSRHRYFALSPATSSISLPRPLHVQQRFAARVSAVGTNRRART